MHFFLCNWYKNCTFVGWKHIKALRKESILKKWIFILGLIAVSLGCQAEKYRTHVVTPETVKSLRLRYVTVSDAGMTIQDGDPERVFLVKRSGEEIGEGGDARGRVLEISFDELSHEVRQYTYKVLHLNADGTESNLSSYEYVGGFTTGEITNYEHSLNTSVLYTHYSFTFPNSDIRLLTSGNYALKIYEDGDEDKTVATVVVSVVEPAISVVGKVRSETDIEINRRFQQLDVSLSVEGVKFNGQMTDYFIVVRQNGRYDNEAFKPKPTYIESNKLRYTNCKELIYEGGNEYRHFDIFSTYFAGAGVDRIVHDHTDYHAALFADGWRTGNYMHEFDVDGQWKINAERTLYDMDTEAEYMWVHWVVPCENPWFDGAVYVGGDLFENNLSMRNRMAYDGDRKCYWLDGLFKQGGYDYQYWFVPNRSERLALSAERIDKAVTLERTEGSRWETRNEYTIYVYYRPFGSRADQLVGLQVLR